MKNIITVPNPVLRKMSEPVKKIDKEIKELVQELWNALTHSQIEGVGIAAPQIGVTKRIFILRQGKNNYQAYINPSIAWESEEMTAGKTNKGDDFLEGCLSIPNLYGSVLRPASVELVYTDLNGTEHKKKLTEPFSRYSQHELDHLNGILFTDRILSQKGKLFMVNKNDELEEINVSDLIL
jgi:peptide deformylase